MIFESISALMLYDPMVCGAKGIFWRTWIISVAKAYDTFTVINSVYLEDLM